MESLFPLLRAEMMAVNQQFIHILALRRRGDVRRAERIYEVDRIDFPNVMRIIDRAAASGTPIALLPQLPKPGLPLTGLLRAELEVEDRLRQILAAPLAVDRQAQQLLDAALAPRAAYRDWLAAELGSDEHVETGAFYPAVEPLFSCLILMLERWMVQAFIAWHRGATAAADIAWATSGVAMVHATDLVNALTDLDAVPNPATLILAELPATLVIGDETGLIAAQARLAREAALREKEPSLQAICAEIAAYADTLAAWTPNRPHPALQVCAPSFRSFDATRRKFVAATPVKA